MTYVNEFFALVLVFRSASLILEDDIIVPPRAISWESLRHSCKMSYLRLTLKSDLGFSSGFPSAMSFSRAASSSAAFSRSCISISRTSGVIGTGTSP